VVLGALLLAAAILPVLLVASQHQLNDARNAARAGNCPQAINRAADAVETLSIRPEPYEVMAICQARRGEVGLAIRAMRKATALDPNYWWYHYQLAILLGAAGQDPRPELLTTRRLNPFNTEAKDLLATVPAGQTAGWGLDLLRPYNANPR
jgi:hypothetical protein